MPLLLCLTSLSLGVRRDAGRLETAPAKFTKCPSGHWQPASIDAGRLETAPAKFTKCPSGHWDWNRPSPHLYSHRLRRVVAEDVDDFDHDGVFAGPVVGVLG